MNSLKTLLWVVRLFAIIPRPYLVPTRSSSNLRCQRMNGRGVRARCWGGRATTDVLPCAVSDAFGGGQAPFTCSRWHADSFGAVAGSLGQAKHRGSFSP